MSVYLAIVAGIIKFANYVAASLQQHHDELNGANKQKVAIDEANLKELEAVAAPTPIAIRDELWVDNKKKFGADGGASRR